MRRLLTLAPLLLGALLAVLAVASPASAVTLTDKLTVLSTFTQPTSPSQSAWYAARQQQSAWSAYGLDWSTDYCSDSPDNPLGFDFKLSCARHDFGYRNYKAVGQFPANKARIDNSFYFDLRAKCATYSIWVRSACYGLAWTYYEAVHLFGSVVVDGATLATYATMKADGLRREYATMN
jgi:hypothetical protein